jgi:hypothetical protein
MEIIGRRWSTAGAIIKGFTVLSSFLAVRVDLSEQFPTALRGRGHFSGEAAGRILLWCANSVLPGAIHRAAAIFFGTIAVVAIDACIPLLFGKETVAASGQACHRHRA